MDSRLFATLIFFAQGDTSNQIQLFVHAETSSFPLDEIWFRINVTEHGSLNGTVKVQRKEYD